MVKTPAKTTRKKTPKAASPHASKSAKTARIAEADVLSASAPRQAKPRRLRKPEYKSFKVHKHIKSEGSTVPGAYKLLRAAIGVLVRNWWVFIGISLIYGILNFVLVQGFAVQGLGDSKTVLEQSTHGGLSWLTNGASLFAVLLSSAGGGDSAGADVYQVSMQLIVSLAIIWTLRQIYAGRKVGIRDGFYQGIYPLVPFLLVLVVILLQLLPAAAGVYLYEMVSNNGIAASPPEQILWALVAFLSVLLSLYLVCGSIMALYVVSLPNMTPLAALRSAKQLVLFKRWAVLRKILFLPVILLLVGALILIPVIVIITPAAPWVFLALSMFILPIIHSYLYALYRSLL
jgi:hypothetical protein